MLSGGQPIGTNNLDANRHFPSQIAFASPHARPVQAPGTRGKAKNAKTTTHLGVVSKATQRGVMSPPPTGFARPPPCEGL